MMFLHQQTAVLVNNVLKEFTGEEGNLKMIKPVPGGSINNCYQLAYSGRTFFIKVNSAKDFKGMFEAEAKGLKALATANAIKVPGVIRFENTFNEQFLILEWIEKGVNNSLSQEALGRSLAKLHKNTSPYFGLDHHNFMGSLTQSNNLNTSWSGFFISERLKPQIELGTLRGLLDKNVLQQFELLFNKLDELYPRELPALVHGDLWSGNYMISNLQEPVLIDPAIAYANREVDLAMTTLFGGFQGAFYDAYHEVFPLQEGWKDRVDVWNLYPLLVHLNLFGRSYLGQVKAILNWFVKS
jgi:fructosamine-3-kinase